MNITANTINNIDSIVTTTGNMDIFAKRISDDLWVLIAKTK
jgi:hypothetical protein